MRIKLYTNKSIHENAAYYYDLAKEAKKKAEGLGQAIEETRKQIEKEKKKQKKEASSIKMKKEKVWYEKFNWFMTSGGKLAIGGKNAQQNDQIFAKHMEDNDLFFHADIQGGTAVILKDGVNADEQEMLETAQFAGSFSNAWKNANAAVDVYSVKKEQLSKHAQGGYIPTGAFAITGKKTWFRSTPIAVRIGIEENEACVVPSVSKRTFKNEAMLVPSKSGNEKGKLAKLLAKRFGVHPDDLLGRLPNGKSKIAADKKKT